MFATFDVQSLSDTKQVEVRGETLGDLRLAVKSQFDIPTFEQQVLYSPDGAEPVALSGDDSVLLTEKEGLIDTKLLQVARQVDPRFKMEKETAFVEALAARRFEEAKGILESSGVTVDPNCVHRASFQERIAVTECPRTYTHPALTVAIMAGLEHAVRCSSSDADQIQKFMSNEKELCDVVQLMIEKRADVDATGEEVQDCESAGCPGVHGKTPLCAAVQRGSPRLVRMLLDAKADPNHEMKYDSAAYGPDRNNPLGPGNLKPESWLSEISNGFVHERNCGDPRNQFNGQILAMLRED